MPKLACPCGHAHNLSPIPDHGWQTGLDSEWEAIVEREYAIHHQNVDDSAPSALGRLYECPNCGRLMWQRPGDPMFRSYTPETT